MQQNPNNLRFLNDQIRDLRALDRANSAAFDGGGGGGYDPRMEERVKVLEKFAEEARTELRTIDVRLAKIETRMDNFASKDDVKGLSVELHRELNATTWKIIGALGLVCAAVFWTARNVQPPQAPDHQGSSVGASAAAPAHPSSLPAAAAATATAK